LVFDITDLKSFRAVETWVLQIKKEARQDVKILLIGNKTDMAQDRVVSFKEAKQLAEELELEGYYETSAKSGEGVEKVFSALLEIIMGSSGERTKQEPMQEGLLPTLNVPSSSTTDSNNKCGC
jgi:GTPase SAR1 family protein